MSESIIAPFKNHDHIAREAQNFLKKYHPLDAYPIPIEEIIEFQLKIDIIPLPNMHKTFGIDGFLSSDRASISVDEGIYQSRPGGYRFTLAHEVGHYILHKAIYEQGHFDSIKEWQSFIGRLSPKQYSWFEWQAYEFAGLILVPTTHLDKRLRHHEKYIKSLGIQNEEVILDQAIEELSKDFVVSREVIQRRLNRTSQKSQ